MPRQWADLDVCLSQCAVARVLLLDEGDNAMSVNELQALAQRFADVNDEAAAHNCRVDHRRVFLAADAKISRNIDMCLAWETGF
jgi:ABC-type branched-subunit amino acid transport system ATPase component